MKKYMVMYGCMLFFMFAILSSAFAIEITADMVTKEGKVTRNGKIYVKDSKCRVEKGSTPLYTIVRGDKGLFWQVNSAEKTYIEARLTPDMKPTIEEKIFGETGRKLVGTETVNGFTAKKYEVTAKKGKKTETIQQWFSTEYNFPVRVVGSNWSVEYKNIKKGAVSDSLFELAPGLVEDNTEVPDVLH
jgi:outer membrane lipoprotein-sorting protein